MLKIVDITKEYVLDKEEKVFALKGVSIEFRRNEFVSILGPSGCGKTTLLNIIGGLDRYSSGDIQIEGVSTKEYDDVDWDTYRNRRIGFVFQSYNLIPHMNILKNVALSLTLAGVEREERYRRAKEALEKVGLGDQVKKKPSQLSGGQMQRVAIARALVNNPEIILADEPTGALDSESGLQVMDLLKEVAKDRLVIMVTHNPTLAEEYSTRIVYLKDGQVDGDTMPYDSAVEPEGELLKTLDEDAQNLEIAKDAQAEETTEEISADETPAEDTAVEKKDAPVKKESKFKRLFRKRRAQDRTSMKLRTAINLSWNNLRSKKGRTILTSIAGSIGIIGIVLVLSLSTGAKAYINNLEENALSSYPLTISQSNMDMSAIFSIIMTDDGTKKDKNPNTDVITTHDVIGKIIGNIAALTATNDLTKFRNYIEKNFDKELATVSYNYGIYFNAYIKDPKTPSKYMKVNPYTEAMPKIMAKVSEKMKEAIGMGLEDIDFDGMNMDQMLSMATTTMPGMMDAWSEMSSNQKLLESQYELVGSHSKWPTRADEIVIVVDNKNQFNDYQLFMLGLKSEDDVVEAFMSGEAASYVTNVDELLKMEYTVLTEADYLEEDVDEEGNGLGTWHQHAHDEQSAEFVESFTDAIKLKVVGVIRPKPGVEAGSIGGVIGYTEALTGLLIEKAKSHPAVKAMLDQIAAEKAKGDAGSDYFYSNINFTSFKGNVTTTVGEQFDWKDTDSPKYKKQVEVMRALGVANLDEPTLISFYCNSFEAKEKIIDFINEYNKAEDQEIRYSDNLATMMSFVNTMANTITGVLVAFAAISLIVSTIMIAIIIYTSVLERRKEIGVLRSIGARKKDVARVFIAESAILGGYSGLIGVFVSFIISLAGSAILKAVFQIEGLMRVTWWHCLMMVGISVLLSMLAGFIPSRIAAKKDPAIALRSE